MKSDHLIKFVALVRRLYDAKEALDMKLVNDVVPLAVRACHAKR